MGDRAMSQRTPRAAELIKALRMARRVIAVERDEMLDGACMRGPDGKPNRATMDGGMRPYILRLDRAIRQIDRVLP